MKIYKIYKRNKIEAKDIYKYFFHIFTYFVIHYMFFLCIRDK